MPLPDVGDTTAVRSRVARRGPLPPVVSLSRLSFHLRSQTVSTYIRGSDQSTHTGYETRELATHWVAS